MLHPLLLAELAESTCISAGVGVAVSRALKRTKLLANLEQILPFPSVISDMILVVNVPNCFTPLSLMVVDVQLIQSKDARRQKA